MASPTARCPEFLPDFTWLNTRRPRAVASDLKGRVALLDFGTHCCVTCLHALPMLNRLEDRFSHDPFLVTGVHSAKFLSGRDPDNIRQAIRRYRIRHSVVLDSDHLIWRRFAVRAWPTLILADARGYVRETWPGEAEEEDLAERIRSLLAEGEFRGVLADRPLEMAPDPEDGTGLLSFPGRVHRSGEGIFVADSGHHRVMVADPDGRLRHRFGEGGIGAHDGPASEASFFAPQGMAAAGENLFVADTGNHLLRRVDLTSFRGSTVAGTGEKGRGPERSGPREPRRIPLRSSWGLLAIGSQILIGKAGSHQIWVYDSERRFLGPWAGSGREDHTDGGRGEATFAQPSGLAQAGRFVLVADSEDSSIRAIDFQDHRVRTIVGRGLFDASDIRRGPPLREWACRLGRIHRG